MPSDVAFLRSWVSASLGCAASLLRVAVACGTAGLRFGGVWSIVLCVVDAEQQSAQYSGEFPHLAL